MSSVRNAKKSIKDLSLFGGNPLFSKTLHVGRPNIGSKEKFIERISGSLERSWLTNRGPLVQEFEQKLAEYLSVKHCITVSSGTVGLEIAVRALGMTGEVIVPSFTFVATAHALQWQEITPVFCDIDSSTHNIDPDQIERHITPKTSGIIGVHLWGRPCNIDVLEEIANHHNLKLLFDAAHAFGGKYKKNKIGAFGRAEVFSFHATKIINTFEGGAITTNDDELAEKIRLMINFGFSGMDNVVYLGSNGKMSEASAAMGLTSLESLEEFIAINAVNYKAYTDCLSALDGVKLMNYYDNEAPNYHYIILEVDHTKTSLNRDNLIAVLHAENIRARRYFYPGCHRMEPYKSLYPNAALMLSKTEMVSERVVCLPTGAEINGGKIERICEIIRLAVENGAEVSRAISRIRSESSES